MAGETWRVVPASGEVREVRVEQIPSGRWAHWWHVVFDAMPPGGGTMPATVRPAGAVLGAMWTVGWDVREILAPGEPTRAELIAQRDAARAEAALCVDIHNDTVREMRESAARGAAAYLRMTERAEAAEGERDALHAKVAELRAELAQYPERRECPDCNGVGSVNRYRCGRCRGDGVIEVPRG